MRQNTFGLSAPPDSLAAMRGPTSKLEGERKERRGGEGRERKGGRGWRGRKGTEIGDRRGGKGREGGKRGERRACLGSEKILVTALKTKYILQVRWKSL